MIVVSLSTIPPRFNMLGDTLRSILNQRHKIDVVRVNIPRTYRRFPEHEFYRPDLPDGVTISVGDEDYGPATKILPTLTDYRDRPGVRIIYCDDDRIAHPDWIGGLIAKSNERPGDCIVNSGWHLNKIGIPHDEARTPRGVPLRSLWDSTYRWNRIRQQLRQLRTGKKLPKPPRTRIFGSEGYVDIAEGCGGVLVRPDSFDDRVFDVPAKLWSVDDIWLSGMLEANNVGVWMNRIGHVPAEQDEAHADALYLQVIEGYDRQQANAACARYLQENYGVWQSSKLPGAAKGSVPA
ncbi:glycosyltransferase family 2 protein [Pseudooceanicola algae]|nr:glycosyltransferase family 2 protein [Pseudooceanicola algae]